jgi:hypothetical protein
VEFCTDLVGSIVPVQQALKRYVDLGSELLRKDPERFEQTVQQLFEAASYMNPKEAREFLQERVSRQTFAFQDRFDELVAPSPINLSQNFAFHINTSSLLLSASNATLIPPSILNPDPTLDEFDPANRFYVYFATGDIDGLSKFLAGHALLRSPQKEDTGSWEKPSRELYQMNVAAAWACEPTGQRFPKEFMLAVIRPDYSDPSVETADHDIESPVRANDGVIGLVKMRTEVQVELINIPTAVLLPSQRHNLTEESQNFMSGAMQAHWLTQEPFQFAKQYVLTRHAELALKLALLELWESKFENGFSRS